MYESNSPIDLTGQVALVTGGGRGLGRVFAQALAAVGAAVAVAARSEHQLAETVSLIKAKNGQAIAVPFDVTDESALERAGKIIQSRLGPVDLLVNNAGFGTIGAFVDLPLDRELEQLDLNACGVGAVPLHNLADCAEPVLASRDDLLIEQIIATGIVVNGHAVADLDVIDAVPYRFDDTGAVEADVQRWLDVIPLALTSQQVQTSVAAMQANVLTAAAINAAMVRAAKSHRLKGVLAVNDRPLVSADFNHNSASSVFDLTQTQVLDDSFVRVLSWYDNEWGFSNRMSDVAVVLGKLL